MKKWAILAALALAGCGPAAERAPGRHEQLIAAQQRTHPDGHSTCFGDGMHFDADGRGVQGVIVAYPPGDCDALGPAEVIRGIWYAGFEDGEFIEHAETVPLVRDVTRAEITGPDKPHLLIDRREEARAYRRAGPGTRAVRIVFIGRRKPPYLYRDGRQGWPFIVVDRIVSTQDLGEVETRWDCRDFPADRPRPARRTPGA